MKRRKIPLAKSKRMFSRNTFTHPKNVMTGFGGPMRGGIRL